MTLDEAVKLWVNRDFANIPTELIKKAYKDNFEELELLSSEFPELDYPAGWGTMFHPDNRLDEDWIRYNIEEVENCGFLVYECDTDKNGAFDKKEIQLIYKNFFSGVKDFNYFTEIYINKNKCKINTVLDFNTNIKKK